MINGITVEYEVHFSDPYPQKKTFTKIKDAFKYAKRCHDFLRLTKVVSIDLTNLVREVSEEDLEALQ